MSLPQELSTDPLTRGYAGMTDAQAAASLNTADRTVYRPVDAAGLNAWAAGGAMMRIRRAILQESADPAVHSDAVLSVCWAAWRMLDRDTSEYDHASHEGMIDALVAAGVLLASDKTALVAMAAQTVSRAEELGLNRVTAAAVTKARA